MTDTLERANTDHQLIGGHYDHDADGKTHDDINPTRIVPLGPELDLTRPHGREKL